MRNYRYIFPATERFPVSFFLSLPPPAHRWIEGWQCMFFSISYSSIPRACEIKTNRNYNSTTTCQHFQSAIILPIGNFYTNMVYCFICMLAWCEWVFLLFAFVGVFEMKQAARQVWLRGEISPSLVYPDAKKLLRKVLMSLTLSCSKLIIFKNLQFR